MKLGSERGKTEEKSYRFALFLKNQVWVFSFEDNYKVFVNHIFNPL